MCHMLKHKTVSDQTPDPFFNNFLTLVDTAVLNQRAQF